MSNNDLSSIFAGEDAKPQRSTFLTVLCILSFLGGAYIFTTSTTSYFNASKAVEAMKIQSQKNDSIKVKLAKKDDAGAQFGLKVMEGMKDMLDVDKIKRNALSGIATSLLTLTGAILMFRLKKIGFYLYVAGTVISLITPFIIYGTNNFTANIAAAISAFIGIVFIAMYAFNLKELK